MEGRREKIRKGRGRDQRRRRISFKREGHVAHGSSNFFDMGELGIELALVLCSVAMLAKSKALWIVGIVVGVLGFSVAMCGFFSEPILDALQHVGVFRP